MDKEKLMKEAEEYVGDGYGYIHSEMKNWKSPQLVMAGDTFAIMWQVCGIITRLSELLKLPFEEVAGMTFNLPKIGYENVKNALKNTETKIIGGEDWQEKWKVEKEKELRKEANLDNITLAFNLSELEKRNTSLNNQLVDLKKDYQKKLKAKDDDIKKLSKEVLSLEHRLKEMEEQRQIPFSTEGEQDGTGTKR